jgi:glycosyltransferase involved in cell wall biosynthesis
MLVFHRAADTWGKRVNTYIALTEFSRRKFIEGGLPAEKIVVKPNFLYPDPGPRTDQSCHALFVGRLSSEKGISTLLRAWEMLPGVPLKVAGDGPMMPIVESAARTSGRADIECLGWLPRKEVLGLLRGARVLVVPSEWYEGFPLAIVEALARGVPVVGSNIGGVGEIVESGQSGVLFEPGNETDLAEKVNRLWSDNALHERLGANARSQFENHYTADKNYEILMEIFERGMR